MAELPEVEIFKRHVERTAFRNKIQEVDVRNRKILKEVDLQRLQKGLRGHTFESARRHGTYLFLRLDSGRWLSLYFGLTREGQEPRREGATEDRLSIVLEEGQRLSPHTMRLQGVALVDSVDDFVKRQELGPDVLEPRFNQPAFQRCLDEHGDMMIKSLLMDQKIMAGIGSVYSDEILYHARLHPRTRVEQLDETTRKRLFDTMKEVLYTAIDRRANPDRFPDEYLTSRRQEDEACPDCQGKIKRVQVDDYVSYFCPACQESPDEREKEAG